MNRRQHWAGRQLNQLAQSERELVNQQSEHLLTGQGPDPQPRFADFPRTALTFHGVNNSTSLIDRDTI